MENPTLTGVALRQHCSRNYPFGERRGYAYKAFLAAMRNTFGRKIAKKHPGQPDMLDNS